MNNNFEHWKEEQFSFWISGFVDGEGCFSISARFRTRATLGIEIQPSFSIAQKKSPGNLSLLKEIRGVFNTGGIRGDKNVYKYEIRKLTDLVKIIIPFFEKYQLKTDKKKDFLIFSDICSRMRKKEHLKKESLIDILQLLSDMNLSGTRRFSIKELVSFLINEKPKHEILNKNLSEEFIL